MMLLIIKVLLNLHFALLKLNNLQEKHYYKTKLNQILELIILPQATNYYFYKKIFVYLLNIYNYVGRLMDQ